MKTNPNDPINPTFELGLKGITKREYFAALALSALLPGKDTLDSYQDMATDAVYAADCLIEALNVGN